VLPGAVVARVGSYLFMEQHVYPPWGVVSMLAVAAGWLWMLTATRRAH
jgi:hypothetical protein